MIQSESNFLAKNLNYGISGEELQIQVSELHPCDVKSRLVLRKQNSLAPGSFGERYGQNRDPPDL